MKWFLACVFALVALTWSTSASANGTQWENYHQCKEVEAGNVGSVCSGPHPDAGSGLSYYQILYANNSWNQFWITSGGVVCPDPDYPPNDEGECVDDTLPTEAECLARNVPDEGDTDGRGVADRLYVEGSAPTHYCNGHCNITVSPPIGPSLAGTNPVTGLPISYTKHHQIYAPFGGASVVCDESVAVNQDGNPENSLEVPSSQPNGEQSCDPDHGTCMDPVEGLQFCTFSGSPPEPSSCVPASGDGDGDGIPNDVDSAPNDPTNGEDETGDESDNVSSGGGSCVSPPQSSGDGILTQIAYQAWATRCAVEALPHGNTSSGTGALDGSMDAHLSNIEFQAEVISADTAAIRGALTGSPGSFGTVTDGIPAEGVDADDAFGNPGTETGIESGFDDSGFLSEARECPNFPTITMPAGLFGGYVLDLDEKFEKFCAVMYYAGLFIWLFAAIASLKIYSKVFT